jgi:hypothetical protein
MQRVTATIKNRKGKVIARAVAYGEDGSVEPIRAAAEEMRRQKKAREAAIKSKRQGYRRKRKADGEGS